MRADRPTGDGAYTRYSPPQRRDMIRGSKMNRYQLLVTVVGTAIVAGCASTARQAAVQDDDKTYITGSRIPVHSGTGARDVKAVASRQGIDDMLHRIPELNPQGK